MIGGNHSLEVIVVYYTPEKLQREVCERSTRKYREKFVRDPQNVVDGVCVRSKWLCR